jgi:phage-related protein
MKEKLDNLAGSIKILKASLQTAAITIGSEFTPYLKIIADVLREVVNAFIKLPAPVKSALGLFLLLGGSSLLVGGALFKISSGALKAYKGFVDLGKGIKIMFGLMGNVVKGFQALNAVLLANPVLLLILALIALAVIFYLLYTKSETFRRGIHRIGEAAQEAGRWILEAFKKVWNWIKSNWDIILAVLLGPFGVVLLVARRWGDQVVAIFNRVVNWIKRNWDIVLAILTGPFGLAILFVRRWGDDFVKLIKSAIDKAVGFIKKLPYYFGYAIGALIGGAVLLQIKLVQLFVRMWGKLLDLITRFGIDFTKESTKFMLRLPDLFISTLTKIITFVVSWVAQMIAKIIELGVKVIATIIQFWGQLPGLILGFLTTALSFVLNWGGQIISAMFNAASTAVQTAVNFFAGLPGRILGALGDAYSLLFGWGKQLVQGLIDGIKSLVGDAVGIVKDIGGGAVSGFKKVVGIGSPSKVMHAAGVDMVRGLVLGLARGTKLLQPSVDVLGKASTALPSNYQGMAGGYVNRSTVSNVEKKTEINVFNPVREAAEDSISREMQKLAYVGIAG